MKHTVTIILIFLNIGFSHAQSCVFFLSRIPLPEPDKSYKVYEFSPITQKEDLVLEATYDSSKKALKKIFHKEFYVWADGYQDPGLGMILLDENKNPLKEITLRRGESADGEYNYWELTKNHYNASGKLIYSDEPSLKNIPLSLTFEDSLLEGYLEKHYYNSSNSECKSFYQYDSLGKISIIKNYNINGDSILNYFVYDKNNRIVLNKIMKNGLLFREIKHSYEGGYYFKKIYSYEYENGKQRKIDEKAIFKIKYDNNKIVYQSYSLDGEVLHETLYKYNPDGNLSECHQYEEDKNLKRIMKYKY